MKENSNDFIKSAPLNQIKPKSDNQDVTTMRHFEFIRRFTDQDWFSEDPARPDWNNYIDHITMGISISKDQTDIEYIILDLADMLLFGGEAICDHRGSSLTNTYNSCTEQYKFSDAMKMLSAYLKRSPYEQYSISISLENRHKTEKDWKADMFITMVPKDKDVPIVERAEPFEIWTKCKLKSE